MSISDSSTPVNPASQASLANPANSSVDRYANPYYLHTNDHAGLILVTDRLNTASDFHSWKRSVRMALNVRNKIGFIDGKIPRPATTDDSYGAWSRCNDMVATWLMNSVSKKIGQSLLFISTAEGIWNNLLARFKQDDAPRVYDIEQKLSKIEQGSLDISAYYTELITLWEEHKNFVELPVCTCGKCECKAAQLWESLQERSRVTKFLMGLNASYEQTRRQVLMMKPLPNIEEAFNIVSQDERQRLVKPTPKQDAVAFNVDVPVQPIAPMAQDGYAHNGSVYVAAAYNAGKFSQRPVCTYCNKTGHTVNKCFKKFGYPPGYKGTGSAGFRPLQQQNNPFPQPWMPLQTQQQMSSRPQSYQHANAVANVYADSGSFQQYAYPQPMPHITSGGANLNLQDFTPQQIQGLLSQFNSKVQTQENATTAPNTASITNHGVMAQVSTSGSYSGLDDWEG